MTYTASLHRIPKYLHRTCTAGCVLLPPITPPHAVHRRPLGGCGAVHRSGASQSHTKKAETKMTNQRFARILAAHKLALGDRDPETVGIADLLPAIIKAVPGTTPLELAEAFRWRAEQNVQEAIRRKPDDEPPDAA
jgi:hypothetical protein